MSQSSADQHQSGFTIGECTDDLCPPSDLTHDPLHRVVGFKLDPVRLRIVVVSQRLVDFGFDQFSRFTQTHDSKGGDNSLRFFFS